MQHSTKQKQTSFCKICKDSGKTEKDYTSHNVRRRGQVVCPVLLATTCQRCNEKGHMTSYCRALPTSKTARCRRRPINRPVDSGNWTEVKVKVKVVSHKKTCRPSTFTDVTNKFAGLEVEKLVKCVVRQPLSSIPTQKRIVELPWGKPLTNWASDDDE